MKVNGQHYRTIWIEDQTVKVIDQRKLPFEFVIETIDTLDHMIRAIRDMHVRGAPLIGAAAAFGVYLAAREQAKNHTICAPENEAFFAAMVSRLLDARPTAVNLQWAGDLQLPLARDGEPWQDIADAMKLSAQRIADDDIEVCKKIGEHGVALIESIHAANGGNPVNIMTHCNAGWLATIDYGTATAPIYTAASRGIPMHVWVDETRPRLQGSRLTAFELAQAGINHTIIVDSAGGLLMQRGDVDLCLVGTDRTTKTGDVVNKIGTYLKALAAVHNQIPFYVCVPSSSIDWGIMDGLASVPIEQRDDIEVTMVEGRLNGSADETARVRITPKGSAAKNYAFDVTPSELVTGLITERGITSASEESLLELFPEQRGSV